MPCDEGDGGPELDDDDEDEDCGGEEHCVPPGFGFGLLAGPSNGHLGKVRTYHVTPSFCKHDCISSTGNMLSKDNIRNNSELMMDLAIAGTESSSGHCST